LIYRFLFKLFLQRIDAETAHVLAARVLRVATRIPVLRNVLRSLLRLDDPRLQVKALGMTFPSPLGAAAGMDKDGSWFEGLGLLGFGFVEVGTVTARPQPGNQRPRVFRLIRDRALLNSMGFPNPGASATAGRLRRRTGDTIVGVNVGKSRTVPLEGAGADYRAAVRQLAPVCDYVVLNVSSPNTPGLRDMQAIERLGALLADVREELSNSAARPPILVKIGPDLSDEEINAICDLALARGLDGIVAVNTTVARDGLAAGVVATDAPGGISGAPLKGRALEVLQRLYARVGDNVVLVSVGGIESPADAWERILAGATLVQAYTGFVYGGPLWPWRMNRGLLARVRNTEASSIRDLVGANARHALHDRPLMTS
jgi:dihydroorotate dehydrogenase